MKSITKVAIVAAVAALSLTACDYTTTTTPSREEQLSDSQDRFDQRVAPDVTGDAEYQNYIRAQEDVYDDPANILWCTASFPSSASPIFTVPIAGKLTSSSVSFYPNESPQQWGWSSDSGGYMMENQSVDGMYHGSPPAYRYGFTPGGQYVDFSNLAVFCTTALTEFQRQSLSISVVDPEGQKVTDAAEDALEAGDGDKAEDLTDSLGGQ